MQGKVQHLRTFWCDEALGSLGAAHLNSPSPGKLGQWQLMVPWLRQGSRGDLGAHVCSQILTVFSCSAIDYIQFLHKEKKKQEEEVSTLRKDVMALKIMKV